MKSGTGDDPFADPFEEDAEADDTSEPAAEADESETEATSEAVTESETSAAGTTASGESAPTGTETDEVDEPTDSEADAADSSGGTAVHATDTADSQSMQSDDTGKPDDSHIPWVLRRSSVKDDRPNITQFFLRDETDRGERALRSDVEQILDKDVYTLDLREAAYLVAMEHPEEVAETLREWGYDYLD